MKFEKSASTHVCNVKIFLRRRMMLPFVFTDRSSPKEAYKHTCWVVSIFRKNFGDFQPGASQSLTSSFWRSQNDPHENHVWVGMKFEKSASTHVCSVKIFLRRRMMLPFVSTDRSSPKEAYKHTCWVVSIFRKNFGDFQPDASRSLASSFWGSQNDHR